MLNEQSVPIQPRSQYEILILGDVPADYLNALTNKCSDLLSDFDLKFGSEVKILDSGTLDSRRPEAASCAVYFGSVLQQDLEEINSLRNLLVPIIPVLNLNTVPNENLPEKLCDLNVHWLDPHNLNFTTLAISIFENLGLLREQRRVFISYRRTESAQAAMQLHDEFSHRGFDVFLDTHSIRSGKVFQEVLWHRLCDSDVLVMLDTPTYFESRWTTEELGKARAKEIKVLRVVWPSDKQNSELNYSEDIFLKDSDFNEYGQIADDILENISDKLEDVRSRSIAARAISITGKFRAAMKTIGANVIGVGTHRAIKVQLQNGKFITAYPAVGVPTAETMNSVDTKFGTTSDTKSRPFLIYDHTGIGNEWTKHLTWLDGYISNVELIDVSRSAWEITGKISQ
jgi:hypothetical protein